MGGGLDLPNMIKEMVIVAWHSTDLFTDERTVRDLELIPF